MAYRKGYNFHGNHVNTPGVYSHVESDMRAKKTNGALNIAIIGQALGGKPGEIMFLDDTETAKEVLKGGDLLDACLKAYDPVRSTKENVALGGADLIMAIRSNNATKAETAVYQEREVESTIGKVTATQHANSTGKITTSGAYAGTVNKTFYVEITSEGTKPLAECTYNYRAVTSDVFVEEVDLPLSVTGNATNKNIGDGVLITFGTGNYTKGDSFLIPCTAAVTVNEFVFTIESKDYGKECNLLSHKITDGTLPGTKTLTIYDGKTDYYEVLDNLGGAFDIKYTGDQAYADITIVPDGKGNSIKLQTTIGADKETAIIDLDINLSTDRFKTVKQLSEHIGSFENYEVEIASTISPDLTVQDFDFVTDQSIKAVFPVTAVLRNMQKSTKHLSQYVEVNVINREVSNFSNYPFTSLTGGSEGKNATSFVPFLDQIAKYDLDYVVPLTTDMSILAEVREHCISMSGIKGKERRMVSGGGNGISAGLAVQSAKQLAHSRVQYFGFGFYDYDPNLKVKLYPAYIAAAMHAGRAAFLGVESATGDVYKMLKPEKTFEGRARNEMINNGVLFFDEIASDINHHQFYSRLVWDHTTFSEYNDPLEVERSTGAIKDMLSKKIRKRLDKMATGKLSPVAVLESFKNATLTILKDHVKDGVIIEYRNVVVKKVRDRTDISFEVAPTQVNNFTFVDMVFYDKDIELSQGRD